MQTTSSGFSSVVNSSYRPLNTGVQISWTKTVASGVSFFTINTSTIGGYDTIGTGNSVSLFDKYAYTDYTPYINNWSVDRQLGQYPFGLIMAQADVELNNSSDLFTPYYDATIGSGILPNRPMKISVGMNQDSLSQFVGFTGQPSISLNERKLNLHAFDVVDYLNNYRFTTASGSNTTFSGMLTNQTTSSGISYYLGKLGFNASQYAVDTSLQEVIPFIDVTERKFGDVLQDLVMAEQGMFFADETGIPRFWNRQHLITSSGTGTKFNFTQNNTVSIDYENTPILNDVTVVAKPRSLQLNARIWSLPSSQEILPGQTYNFFADFSDENGALPATAVISPTGSTTDINTSYYTANTASDASGSDQTSNISIVSTYLFGSSYKLVLKNNYTSTIYVTALVLYGNVAKVSQVIQENYIDPTSIQNYGRNPANNGETLLIENDYIQSSSQASSMGYQIVNRYGTPYRRLRIEVFSNPSLQIGDYGSVQPDNRGTTVYGWITGKTDKLAPGGDLSQTLIFDEASPISYFTINQSIIGGTDTIAP